jgi:hypothetical protein
MMKVVKFKTAQIAEQFQEHFKNCPSITRTDNCLTFPEFDGSAFDLVLGLEGLDDSDYFFVGSGREIQGCYYIETSRYQNIRRKSQSDYARADLADRLEQDAKANLPKKKKKKRRWYE